jgi:response regulator NasT
MMTDASNETAEPGVLIADEDAIARLDLRDLLKTMGYRVVGETRDGPSAIAMASKLRPDLVIMAVPLAGEMDGIDAAAALTDRRVAPVLLLSHFCDPLLAHRAAEAGAAGYVLKPFAEDNLRPAIEIALSRSRRIKALEEKVLELLEEMETRKVVEEATGMLMREHALSEEEAIRRMERAGAESRKTMRAVAEAIILAQRLGM